MRFFLLPCFLISLFFVTVYSAEWGTPPEGWDGFQFGLVEANTSPWKEQLVKALDMGFEIDYRYRYCTSPDAPTGWIFTPWYNYAKGPNGIKPSITIYMAAGNLDDVGKIGENGSNKTFMTKYFNAIKTIADSCKGYKPIFVIEPDVWGYFLQYDNAGLGDRYLNQTCYINNLGFSCLSGFSNTFKDLPGAIIALLKEYAPDCYAGILTAHWSFNSFWLPSPEENAEKTIPYLEKLLREPYKGDFLAVEKYGSDAGATSNIWYWDDQINADFVTWTKTLAKGIDLPLLGWQTSIGYTDDPEYPELPNQSFKYQDTFFEYFFSHKEDYIGAGFIGYLAGCANAGQGTVYGTEVGEYDNGWFLDHLKEFVDAGPYDLNLKSSPIIESNGSKVTKTFLKVLDNRIDVNLIKGEGRVKVFTLSGKEIYNSNVKKSLTVNLSKICKSNGLYMIQVSDGKDLTSKVVNFIKK